MTYPNLSPPSTLPPEIQVLLVCARTRMTEENIARIRTLVNAALDWQRLLEAAANHGVTPLVSHHLLTLCLDAIPAERRTQIQDDLEQIKKRNLSFAAEMVRLSTLFHSSGLLVIPYKGPLLAAQAYGDFGLRQFADLDFAIQQRDLPQAAALLVTEGYEPRFGNITADEGMHPTRSEYQFRQSQRNMIVELQTESTLRYFPRPIDLDAMGKRLKKVNFVGREIPAFSPEDTFILLAVHGSKHFWERLMWIADISELVQVPDGIAWPDLFQRADEMGAGRMVRLALCLARQVLDAPLPREILQKVEADSVAVKLAGQISARLSVHAAPLPVLQRFRFRTATRERFSDGIKYALRLATSPADPDRTDMPLPEGFSGALKWMRPVLLMRRYGIRRSKPQ